MSPPNEAAEKFKQEGNAFYSQGQYEAAIERYTQAISLDATQFTYWSNRALCYLKLSQWREVLHDSQQALNCNDESVKAHYFLGRALVELGEEPHEGMKKLSRAKALAESQSNQTYAKDIEKGILLARKKIFLREAETKLKQRQKLQGVLQRVLQSSQERGDMSADEFQDTCSQLNDLFQTEKERLQPSNRNVPEHLCCSITTHLFEDPVVTESGHTYERDQLMEHFQRNGCFDPVTRQTCSKNVVPNRTLKYVVEDYLQENPWALWESA